MDIESARKNLNIENYEHPSNLNTNKDSKYKVFNGEKKKNMDKYKSRTTGKNYGSSLSQIEDKCPVCKEESIYICPCGYSDKKCKNNHIWYIDREGLSKVGNPH